MPRRARAGELDGGLERELPPRRERLFAVGPKRQRALVLPELETTELLAEILAQCLRGAEQLCRARGRYCGTRDPGKLERPADGVAIQGGGRDVEAPRSQRPRLLVVPVLECDGGETGERPRVRVPVAALDRRLHRALELLPRLREVAMDE